MKKVICFGEILWDNLPAGRLAGGAPMNVAYHLKKLGIDASLISRVGDDEAGRELTGFIKSMGLPDDLIQVDKSNKTSEVIARVMDNHEVVYDILYPVAWDFISGNTSYENMLSAADAFVFGSLAARNEVTRNTLFNLLESSAYNVFDVNLRAPHYNPELISQLLHKANLVKLNINELDLIAGWLDILTANEAEKVQYVQQQFNISEVIVTKGSVGASYYVNEAHYHQPACKVEVQDTVGSGDSFLAAFLTKKLQGESLDNSLAFAVAVAAFITTQNGACPAYTIRDLESFIHKNQFNTSFIN